MNILMAAFFMVMLVSPSWAATYYVSTTGNNNNVGSEGSPWRTLTAKTTTLACGDILYVRGGTYSTEGEITFNQSCPSNNKIQVLNYAGEFPLISWSNRQTTTNHIYFNNGTTIVSGITIEGLELYNGYNVKVERGTLITLRKMKIHHMGENGLLTANSGGCYQCTVDRSEIYDNGDYTLPQCGGVSTCNQYHGLYISGKSWTITNNLIYDNLGYGIQFHGKTNNLPTSDYGPVTGSAINNTFAYSRNRAAIVLWNESATAMALTIKNNIFYENSQTGTDPSAINHNQGSVTGTVVQGNVHYATGVTAFLCEFANCSASTMTGATVSNNSINVSNPNMVSAPSTVPASPNFTLTAGSVAIDAGRTDTGLPYDGSAPDSGAHETHPFSSCSVEDGDASNLRINFGNNGKPPLLPSTSISGLTARKAGSNDVIVGGVCARVGDNRVDCPLTDAIVNGNTVDFSYSQTGNLTDSALIGNTSNQEILAITNQSCTNNVGAAATHLFIQAAYEWHGLRGTEAAPVMLRTAGGSTENLDIKPMPGAKARLRFSVTCSTADCPSEAFYPYASKNGGGYAVIPDTFDSANIKFCGVDTDPDIPTSGAITTDQLSTSGTFVAGALVRTSNAIPSVDLDNSPASKTELEYCFAWDTDAVASDTYDIRLRKQDGTVLDTYTATPRATIQDTIGGMGF
jgi:hypothetical protein